MTEFGTHRNRPWHRHGGVVLVAAALVAGGVSCRTGGGRRQEAAGSPTLPEADAASYAEFPDPGEEVPIDPETLGTTEVGRPVAAGATNRNDETTERMVVTGEVEAMGPFTSRDAADGKWIRISSTSGIEYILIPAQLWVRAKGMHINVGVGLRVEGPVRMERGRRHVVAERVSVY